MGGQAKWGIYAVSYRASLLRRVVTCAAVCFGMWCGPPGHLLRHVGGPNGAGYRVRADVRAWLKAHIGVHRRLWEERGEVWEEMGAP